VSSYGFKKPAAAPTTVEEGGDKLDLTGIARTPVALDPRREEEAVARGAAMGFVDRDERVQEEVVRPSRRRRETVPQANLFIKGPQATVDWFIDFTNNRGHRSYWQALEDLRAIVEGKTEER
jgi:hypothetical protein